VQKNLLEVAENTCYLRRCGARCRVVVAEVNRAPLAVAA
jgi:hypothetical protein